MRQFSRGMGVLALVSLVAGVAACNSKDGNEDGEAPSEQAKPGPDTVAAKTPDDTKAAPVDEELKTHMKSHFEAVRGIQEAIVQGSLEAAKQQAAAFAGHEAHADVVAWQEHVERMRAVAAKLGEAKDLQTASRDAALLNGECASCHRDLTAIVTFEWIDKPDVTSGDAKAHMAMHKWGIERLWEGLVGPSDSHWTLGAEALSADPLTQSKEPAGVAELAAKVHELGTKAKTVTESDERAALFGELLTTCSSCHAKTRNK